MEQKAERLVKEDRTHYLQAIEDTGFVWPHMALIGNGAKVQIATWQKHTQDVTLSLNQGGFRFDAIMRVEEARMLGQALLMAAEDAEKAIDAAYAKQMAEDDEVPA